MEFDPDKNRRNIRERGISFALAADFDLASAKIWPDTRRDYGEARYIALGYIGERLYSLVFTVRDDVLRVISLRKANQREVRNYEQQA
ncbi:MAG: BrnT family toxin [Methylococcales bacterium]